MTSARRPGVLVLKAVNDGGVTPTRLRNGSTLVPLGAPWPAVYAGVRMQGTSTPNSMKGSLRSFTSECAASVAAFLSETLW